jgi:8-amino-7-oxononanoate synthase
MGSFTTTLAAELEKLRAAHLYRERRVVESFSDADCAVRVVVDGTSRINFCGNDYLGLSHHPEVRSAFIAAARECGVGSGASHLVSGHSREHHALEEELAAFVQRPRALLFSTGYMANLAAIAALAGRGDLVAEDRLNHASLIDAAFVSGATLKRYTHGSVDALDRLLAEATAAQAIVATDGVFSMDGDAAPLRELAAVCRARDAWLIVDDAHGLGVTGLTGRGSLEQAQLGLDEVPVLVGTLGKAFGTFGAFIAGSAELVEFLIQKARSYIYTTALPPAVAAATRVSLRLAASEDWRRERLASHIERFRDAAASLNLETTNSETPIQAVLFGEPAAALAASSALAANGLWVAAIRPPTVPPGTSRLRITLSAAHSDDDVDRLLAALAALPR